jgi:ABC-type transporter Mla MlaB component
MIAVELFGECSHETLAASLQSVDWDRNDDQRLMFFLKDDPFLDASCIASIVAWGKRYRSEGGVIGFAGTEDTMNYLSRMDVFAQLDFGYHESFNRQNERGRFLPVFLVRDEGSVVAAVESICELVIQRFDNARDFLPAMEWCVGEIIDNVRVHSATATPGAVCAQYYPKIHKLDIAIVDQGRGIRSSLSERLELSGHGEAIERALERGMTRDPDIGQGNGLAGTLEIVSQNGGKLEIWSGDGLFTHLQTGADRVGLCAPMDGTGVYIRLDTTRPVNLADTFIGDSGWSYISYAASRTEDEDGLKISGECRHTLGRETARPLRRKIDAILPEMDGPLLLDFSGVRTATSSFLDELLGRLADGMGEVEFQRKIRLTNMPPEMRNMANVVIAQRLLKS